MTVSSTTRKQTFDGNGSTTVFAIPFEFFEVDVFVNDVLQTEVSDYTKSGGNGATGSITFLSAPAAGSENIVVVGATLKLQGTDLTDNGPFPANSVEGMSDRLTMIALEFEVLFAQTLRVPVTQQSVAEIDFASNASTVLVSNSSGVPELQSPSGGVIGAQVTAAQTAASTATTQASAASTSASNAATSESGAASSANAAATSASNASTSASAASTSETNAATSATNASTSETNAANSASAASTSASNASTSATNAASSASAAATSETNAGTSEGNASTSASNAATSASNAATSATNAATSETNAASSASAAAASAASAPSLGENETVTGNWTYSGTTTYSGDITVAGVVTASDDDGTQDSGTYTPVPTGGNIKHFTNNGAFTLGKHTAPCTIVLLMTNGAAAGAVNTSAFTLVDGDTLTTTNGHKFFLYITIGNGGDSVLAVKALQ